MGLPPYPVCMSTSHTSCQMLQAGFTRHKTSEGTADALEFCWDGGCRKHLKYTSARPSTHGHDCLHAAVNYSLLHHTYYWPRDRPTGGSAVTTLVWIAGRRRALKCTQPRSVVSGLRQLVAKQRRRLKCICSIDVVQWSR